MLYASSAAFFAERHKRITLMGMSNVGKTRLAAALPKESWFHYSVDYRLATAYLRDQIVDSLKLEMMRNSHLAKHLREDAMRIDLNVAFSNLAVVSHYLGMLGDPAKGGLAEPAFRARQLHHRSAEIAAVGDMAAFIAKARSIYGYAHFVNDASGSLCEIIDPDDDEDPVLASLVERSLLVYIQADAAHEARLVEQARLFPKPLYYRSEFLDQAIRTYLADSDSADPALIEPHDFARWIFPRLLEARRPRYEKIARHGCIVSATDAAQVRNEHDFLQLIGRAIDRRANVDAVGASCGW